MNQEASLETFHLKYELGRRELARAELNLHSIWRVITPLFCTLLIFWFAVEHARQGYWLRFAGLVFIDLLCLLWLLRWTVWLRNFVFVARAPVDLVVEYNGIGFLDTRGERWYLANTGFVSVEEAVPAMITLRHWNGHYLHIPKRVLTQEQLAFLLGLPERHKREMQELAEQSKQKRQGQ